MSPRASLFSSSMRTLSRSAYHHQFSGIFFDRPPPLSYHTFIIKLQNAVGMKFHPFPTSLREHSLLYTYSLKSSLLYCLFE